MRCVWDGHDNAMRVQEAGHGLRFPRHDWSDDQLLRSIETCPLEPATQARLKATSARMQSRQGTEKAADLLDRLAGVREAVPA